MTEAAPVFTGVAVALVTLFDEQGEVDAGATADLAGRLVEAGVAAVVVAGTTGEGEALSAAERAKLVEAVRARVAGVPVIAGTGVASRPATVELTRQAREAGADAALVRSPAGVADLRGYYREVAESVEPWPVLAYHFPAVAPPGISLEQLGDLPVAGLKDSSGDPKRLLQTLDRVSYPVYPGSAWVAALAGAVGCPGAILAVANWAPELAVAAFDGDGDAQRWLTAASEAGSGLAAMKRCVAERFGTPTGVRVG